MRNKPKLKNRLMILFGCAIGFLICFGIVLSEKNPDLMYFIAANVVTLIILGVTLSIDKKNSIEINTKLDAIQKHLTGHDNRNNALQDNTHKDSNSALLMISNDVETTLFGSRKHLAVIISLIAGIVFICTSLILLLVPVFDVNGIEPSGKISFAHTPNIYLDSLTMDFRTDTNPHSVSIRYSVFYHNNNNTDFLAFVFPYDLHIINATQQWEIQNFTEIHNTIVFRKFTCPTNSCESQIQTVNLALMNQLDSKKSFMHSIFLPFSDSLPTYFKPNLFLNNLTEQVNSTTLLYGWDIKGDASSKFTNLVLPSQFDQINPYPTAEIDYVRGPSLVNDTQLHWQIGGGNPSFSVEYTSDSDRKQAGLVQQIETLFFGIGVTLIVLAITLHQTNRDKQDLQQFINTVGKKIGNTLSSIENREGLDTEVTITSTYTNLFKLYRLLQAFIVQGPVPMDKTNLGLLILSYLPMIENELGKCARKIDKESIYKLKQATSSIQGNILEIIIVQEKEKRTTLEDSVKSSMEEIRKIVDEKFLPLVPQNERMPDWRSVQE